MHLNDFELKDNNIVRLITQPYQTWYHIVDGKEQVCDIVNYNFECQHCKLDGHRPKWFVGLLNREDNKYYILTLGSKLFTPIANFARNPRFGDPRKYDLNIFKLKPQYNDLNDFAVMVLDGEKLNLPEEDISSIEQCLLNKVKTL